MTCSIYLDANIFIKAVEADDAEAEIAWAVLQTIASGRLQGITSELSVAEVLTKPLRDGNLALARAYQENLQTGAGLQVVPVSRPILLNAALLRAEHQGLRLPDAIHLATALQQGSAAFISNDLRLPASERMEIVRLTSSALDKLKSLSA